MSLQKLEDHIESLAFLHGGSHLNAESVCLSLSTEVKLTHAHFYFGTTVLHGSALIKELGVCYMV